MDYPRYDPASANTPLTDDELDAFDTLLQGLPSEGAMNIEGLDGYLTALLVGPPLLEKLATADWLPVIWGGDGADGAPFPSGRKRKQAIVWTLRHLQNLACLLRDQPDDWQPIFSVAEQGDKELVSAQDWCAGFLTAVDLDPEAWSPLFDDPALGPLLVPVGLLGGDLDALAEADAQRLEDPAAVDELSRQVADMVGVLWAHQHQD